MIITYEGFDRVGKGSSSHLLKERLEKLGNNVSIRHTSLIFKKDLTKSTLSNNAKFFAYFASVRQTYDNAKEDDGPGKVIILDRYIYTHVAYTLGVEESSTIDTAKGAILLTGLGMFPVLDCTIYLERPAILEDDPFAQRVCKYYNKILPKNTIKVSVEEGKINEAFENTWSVFEDYVKRHEFAVKL